MLNPYIYTWKLIQDAEFPDFGKVVLILVENDVILDNDDNWATVMEAVLENVPLTPSYPDGPTTIYQWRLTEYNEDTQEEILRQCYSVVAWRYKE